MVGSLCNQLLSVYNQMISNLITVIGNLLKICIKLYNNDNHIFYRNYDYNVFEHYGFFFCVIQDSFQCRSLKLFRMLHTYSKYTCIT